MRLISHKCLLSVSDEDLETQFVLYKPEGDFDGTYLENHSSYLSANNLQNQDWIEFRRRPTKLVVQNLTGQKESLLVDFDASISSLILFLSKKYSYKEPEKLDLYFQPRPDEALQLGLSLVEQGVEAGACVILQKKEKLLAAKMSLFRKRPGSNYPASLPGGVVRPWQPPDRGGSSGPKPLIFGGTLEEALCGRDLPPLMVKCITYERGIDKEGIFRLSGSAVAIEGFKRAFNEGQDVDLNNCMDIHVVCGLLKQFLRELREPLLTFELYDTFLETGCQLEAVKGVLSRLPELNVRILKYLLGFLSEVASHSASNKMPMHNLATVFAPNLLRMREENIFRIVQDTPAANALTSCLIQNFHSLFPDSSVNGAEPSGTTARARFAVPATQQNGNSAATQKTATSEEDYVSYVRVSYAYEPQDSSELTLSQGVILGVLQDHESGWWKGEVLDPTTLMPSGTIGIFPVTYCDPYEPPAGTARSSAATAPISSEPAQQEGSQTPSASASSQPPMSPSQSSLSQRSPRQLRFGGIAVANVAGASVTSPRTNGSGGGGSLGTSAGSAITTSNVKRPTTPTTGSFIGIPPSVARPSGADSPAAASRTGLPPPSGGRGKFATMRAPPLTVAEAQAQSRAQSGGDGSSGSGGQLENAAASPRTLKSPTVTAAAPSPVGSPVTQARGAVGRPMVPPKELKPRLISTYLPAGGRRPGDAPVLGGSAGAESSGPTSPKGAPVLDWEKEAQRLRGLLEREQQARSELERRVLELEQQLELQARGT